MKKVLFVFALAMLVSLPVAAEAQWGAPGPFVYPEPQIVYPYPPPPVMYPAPPPVMYPAPPQVIYTPPPQVMIQLPPAPPAPQQPHRHHVLKNSGATIVTKCSNCTVTNTINDGRAVVGQPPKPAAASPSADSWMVVLLVAAAMLVALLFGILISQRMTRPRPAPVPTPAVPAPAANTRTDAARRPRPRVHRRKCEHPDCHHKIEICCHAEENGGSQPQAPH